MKTLTLEDEVEAEVIESKLTIEYNRFYTEVKYQAFRLRFKNINKLEQEYYELTETYFFPYDLNKTRR